MSCWGLPVMSCVRCRRMPMRHSRPSLLFLQLLPWMHIVCVKMYLPDHTLCLMTQSMSPAVLLCAWMLFTTLGIGDEQTDETDSMQWLACSLACRDQGGDAGNDEVHRVATQASSCLACWTGAAVAHGNWSTCLLGGPHQKFHVFLATASVTCTTKQACISGELQYACPISVGG